MPTLPIDWCQKAADYRDAYEKLAMGKSKTRVRFGDDEVEYGSANLDALKRLMDDAEAKCAALSSGGTLGPNGEILGATRTRRHAIRGGW